MDKRAKIKKQKKKAMDQNEMNIINSIYTMEILSESDNINEDKNHEGNS